MKITVSDWKPYQGTGGLKGFFKLNLLFKVNFVVHGLVIKCSLFEQDSGARWIGMPTKAWNKRNGQVAYEDQVDYADPGSEEFFHKEVFEQLDKLRDAEKQSEPEPEPSPAEDGLTAPVITDEDIPF